jgi:hypothetical protein
VLLQETFEICFGIAGGTLLSGAKRRNPFRSFGRKKFPLSAARADPSDFLQALGGQVD